MSLPILKSIFVGKPLYYARRLLIGCALITAALAQEVIVTAPQEQILPDVLRPLDQPPVYSRPGGPGETPFQAGSLRLRPHVQYRYVHASGLTAAPGQQVDSEINSLSAGVTLDVGKYWGVDYTPSWTYYSSAAYRDTVDHNVVVRGATVYDDWVLSFAETFSISSPTLIETAQQTKQRAWSTQVGTIYSFNELLQLETTGNLNELYTDISPDMRDWSLTNWLSSKFARDIDGALGLVIGYTDIVGLPDRTYQQYLARANWRFTQKLTLSVSGGLDVRHSKTSNVADLKNPLFQLSLGYRPFDTTTITVTGSRTVSNSYFVDEVTDGSQVNINLEQRLFGKLFLSTGYSHYETDYNSTTVNSPITRSDSINSFNARLTTQLFQRLTVAAVYQSSKNNSSLEAFTFSSNQYGLELGFRY